MKKFNQFILEEIHLKYRVDFKKFLIQDDSEISNYLLENENQEIAVAFTNLEIDRESDDLLIFNPENKKANKNIFTIDPKNLSQSINIKYSPNYIRQYIEELLGDVNMYPYKLPTDFKVATEMELVKVLEINHKFNQITEIPLESRIVPTHNSMTIYILKDLAGVNYIFNYHEFINRLSPIDFKKDRQEKAGVGRLVNKIIQATGGKFTNRELEEFINRYKSYKRWLAGEVRLEVVAGDEIRKWYDEEMYSKGGGTLNNSCMRYPECQDYFDIYTQNPEVCQMLILLNHDGSKIDGRALLWTLTDGKKVMDRIYITTDQCEEIFKKWASENGYLLKIDFIRNGNIGTIQLKEKSYHPYPYLDTFFYFNNGQLSNHTSRGAIILQDTDGEYIVCEICQGEGSISCDECGGNGYFNDGGESFRCDECQGEGTLNCSECT